MTGPYRVRALFQQLDKLKFEVVSVQIGKISKKIVGKTKQMCYHNKEVIWMDEQQKNIPEEAISPDEGIITPEEAGYQPRPKWQVWSARVGLVLFIIIVIMSYILIARGGI